MLPVEIRAKFTAVSVNYDPLFFKANPKKIMNV